MFPRVYVEITNICNMRCSFCHGHSRAPGQMDEALFARILQQLSGVTGYIYYHLMGEPLLHPKLGNFLKMAKIDNFRSIITTNGTLIDQCADTLLSAPLHKLNISLHSFEGQDQAALEGYLEKICQFAHRAADTELIICLRLWNKGFDGGRNDSILGYLRHSLGGEWTENTRGYRIRDRLFLEWGERFDWPDKDADIRSETVYCHGLTQQFGILCDGTVVPCCLDSDGVIALGNIKTQSLSEILSSPRVKAMVEGFRNRRPTEALCRRCGYATRF